MNKCLLLLGLSLCSITCANSLHQAPVTNFPEQTADPVAQQKAAPTIEDLLAAVATSSPSPESQLQIPKQAKDTKFLSGRWICSTGLFNISDRKPVVVEFSFDETGKGSSTIRELSGEVFTASARAEIKDGILRIKTGAYTSPKSSSVYGPNSISCTQGDQAANCSGTNPSISTPWQARFNKIQ